MSWLLDTCVVSEAMRKQPSSRVTGWLARQGDADLHLSALTLGELKKGVQRLPRSSRRAQLEHWLQHELCERFEGRVLPIDGRVALAWGTMQGDALARGEPLATVDSLIAATALVHNLTVVTRNTADMARTRVKIFDPWVVD